KARAAPGVERVDAGPRGKDEIEDAVPGRALGGRADAVAEVLVEVPRPPIPVGGDLSLDDVSHYAFSLPHVPFRKVRTWAVYSSGFSNGGQWPQLFRSTTRESVTWLRMAMLTSKATMRS